VALLRKVTCNLRHPMGLRHTVVKPFSIQSREAILPRGKIVNGRLNFTGQKIKHRCNQTFKGQRKWYRNPRWLCLMCGVTHVCVMLHMYVCGVTLHMYVWERCDRLSNIDGINNSKNFENIWKSKIDHSSEFCPHLCLISSVKINRRRDYKFRR